MTPTGDSDYELFCKNRMLLNFGPEEIKTLYEISQELILKKGDQLMLEGEGGNKMFFLLKGSLKIEKTQKDSKESYSLGSLSPGEVIGELSFLDGRSRSASILAETDAVLRSISFEELEKFANSSIKQSRIYAHMSKQISQRLRDTTEKQIQEYKIRIRMGIFLIHIIALLCLVTFSLPGLKELNKLVPTPTYVTLPFTLVLGGILLSLMKYSNLSWKEFGITLSLWKQAVFDGIVFSLPIVLIGIIAHIFWGAWIIQHAGSLLLGEISLLEAPLEKSWTDLILAYAAYWLLVVPIQELCTRGALQELLENLMPTRHKVLVSIILSNLIFSTTHLYFSFPLAIVVFIGGLYIGWIYSRTHNLISSCLVHAFLGTVMFFLIGI